MKIVVMSDTHLGQVTQEFSAICERFCHDADLVIHLGDWTKPVILDFLQQYPLQGVAGNTDDYSIHSRLPAKKVIAANGLRIGLIHGWGSVRDLQARIKAEFSDVDAIFFGHTHQPLQVKEDGVLWFNPGSVFMGRGQFSGTLGIVQVGEEIRGEIVSL
jgi:uncharacterized protein